MDKIRLLLVSDYRLTRTGLRQMLVSVPDFEVAAETDNPGQAKEIAQRTGANVIILEVTIQAHTGCVRPPKW
jgi:DNA-binding NarL/FixJ family response regulator